MIKESCEASSQGRVNLRGPGRNPAIAVAVFHFEVAAAVNLVANLARDLDALRFELSVEPAALSIQIYASQALPSGSTRRLGRTAPGDSSWGNMMTMHDDDAIAFHHAE